MQPRDRLLAGVQASFAFQSLPPDEAAALAQTLQVVAVDTGTIVLDETSADEVLHLVLAGRVSVTEPSIGEETTVVRVFTPGEAFDEGMALARHGRQIVVAATEPTVLARVGGPQVDALAAVLPHLRAARERLRRRQLLCRLHTLFGTLERTLLDDMETMAAWVRLRRGELLFEQNNAGDGLFFVVSGRVRTISIGLDGVQRVLGDAACGDSVGEMGVFGGAKRAERVLAVRDSVLVGFTSAHFDHLIARQPQLLRRVAGSVVQRLHRGADARASGRIATIAVLPAGDRARSREFCARLVAALSAVGSTLHIDSATVNARMREAGIAQTWNDVASEQLLAWLEMQERTHRFVVYEADAETTPWTRRCLRQADRALWVAEATGDPSLGTVERGLRELDAAVPQPHATLVLLHPSGERLPVGTRRWLAEREVIDHLHVRWDRDADFARVARTLGGRAVSLVLGGGGARGFAHIGALRALEEAGIPIDGIGGTSMGASIAAQYAMGWDPAHIVERNRHVWVQLHPHTKLTIPILSIVGNKESSRCGEMLYGDIEIEDLWLPFFCVSSNLTTADRMVHRSGSLLWAATASASLPGFAVPVLHGEHLLVDGALIDNVPTDVARGLWNGIVIAAEVSVEEDAAFACSRIPTKWEMVRGRFSKDAATGRFPSFLEVAMRAAMLHSIYRERTALEMADLCLRPPIEPFRLMDFARIDEIVECGYASAREAIAGWTAGDALRRLAPVAPGLTYTTEYAAIA